MNKRPNVDTAGPTICTYHTQRERRSDGLRCNLPSVVLLARAFPACTTRIRQTNLHSSSTRTWLNLAPFVPTEQTDFATAAVSQSRSCADKPLAGGMRANGRTCDRPCDRTWRSMSTHVCKHTRVCIITICTLRLILAWRSHDARPTPYVTCGFLESR